MAHLPGMDPMYPKKADYERIRQAQFGGLKHCRSCGDGEIYDMENVTLDELPLLTTRPERSRLNLQQGDLEDATSFYMDNGKLLVVCGQENESKWRLRLKTRNGFRTLISDLQKNVHHQFVRFGDRVVLLPEMRLLNLLHDIIDTKESADELPESATENSAYAVLNPILYPGYYDVYVYDGAEWINNGRFDLPMEADTARYTSGQTAATIGGEHTNTITFSKPIKWITEVHRFKVGDAVTISGCTETENNKTAIIQEITATGIAACNLIFSENCFTIPDGEAEYTESDIRIRRVIPEMDFMFECNNRMWGAKDKRIYASKLGDPTNWYCFEGLSTDSWAIETQTKGKIRGGWGDYYPYFLREDGMTYVCGTVPSGFQTYDKHGVPGLDRFSPRSIAHAGGLTIWRSSEGVVIYGSDAWRIEKDVFRDWYIGEMIGLSAGTKAYFLSKLSGKDVILCFNSTTGLWEKQNGGMITDLCYDGNVVYALRITEERSDILEISGELRSGMTDETEVFSFVRFGDRYLNTENKKTSDLLLLRVELERGATLKVQIMYDSSGEYETVRTISATDAAMKKQQIDIPIQPRRCDHYHIRLEGTGGWTLYSISQNVRIGTEK